MNIFYRPQTYHWVPYGIPQFPPIPPIDHLFSLICSPQLSSILIHILSHTVFIGFLLNNLKKTTTKMEAIQTKLALVPAKVETIENLKERVLKCKHDIENDQNELSEGLETKSLMKNIFKDLKNIKDQVVGQGISPNDTASIKRKITSTMMQVSEINFENLPVMEMVDNAIVEINIIYDRIQEAVSDLELAILDNRKILAASRKQLEKEIFDIFIYFADVVVTMNDYLIKTKNVTN